MTMIDIVRNTYAPSNFWSNVAKRTCRRLLFFRPRLNWRRTIKGFLQEFANFEEKRGYILEPTRERVGEFLARLICRLRRMGELSEAEQAVILAALRRESSVPDVRSERAQALILKACLELGRRRVRFHPGFFIGGALRRRILTVEQIVLLSIDSPLPNPRNDSPMSNNWITEQIPDPARVRSIPEYHLAEGSGDYRKAVQEISLAYDSLDEAFSTIIAKPRRSEREHQFASNYTRMADVVERTFK